MGFVPNLTAGRSRRALVGRGTVKRVGCRHGVRPAKRAVRQRYSRRAGGNYGWPIVSLGRTYQGPWHADNFQQEGFIDPVVYWMPSIAVSGMTFYTGDKLPKWKGDIFVGALRMGEIIGTGHLQRILLNENMQELRRESLLVDWRHRMRDVRQGPDGLLYVLVDADDGAVLRIEPAG
jgi:glucose/arabinose dehydrogenase